jgi:glutamine---fructose-6-phosphate transaminase (isomerizing)
VKSLGKFPDSFIEEVHGQPAALRRAAAGLVEQLEALAGIRADGRDRAVVLTGMGASFAACHPIAAQLAGGGRLATMLDASELLHGSLAATGPGTLVVVVSQSGRSAEIVRLAGELADRGVATVAVTNGTRNPLANVAGRVVDTRAGDETGPSSMTFAASLAVLTAVGDVLADRDPAPSVARIRDDAEAAAVAIERLLADASLDAELGDAIDPEASIVVLGRGPARAAAEMGVLTIQEAAGRPAQALGTAQFRHGPLELAGPGLAAIVVATEADTLALDVALSEECVDAGASVVVIASRAQVARGARTVSIGRVDRSLAPAVALVPIQLLARRIALQRGRDPGTYLRAAKVTSRE